MSLDKCVVWDNEVASVQWLKRFNDCRGGRLASWVSTFHKHKLPCKLASDNLSDDFHGSYNWGCKVIFTNEEKWIVRFPIGGKVKNPDEKVDIEVATINVIRGHTDIPVPEIQAWGLADDNELGLGPFIMFSFVEGVSLLDVLRDPNPAEPTSRLIRKDISDGDLCIIFRQVAKFMLQLSKLDFPQIGSLTRESQQCDSGYAATIHSRPLPWKANEMIRAMGVDVLGPKTTTFSSVTDYFTHVVSQDWKHLHEQLNSVQDEPYAKHTFLHWKALQKLIPRFVSPKHDQGPFKLICDDFGLANMIVNNAEDLKIAAVVDWEWCYAGPSQLLWSAPRWLIIEPPVSWDISDDIRLMYEKNLEIFLGILKEEEVGVLGNEIPMEERPSTLMSQCKTGGKMWFHHLIWEGSLSGYSVSWQQLRAGVSDFQDLLAATPEEEVEAFVKKKMMQLAQYKVIEAEKRVWYDKQRQGDDQWQSLEKELNHR